jgi:hypothetical protein
MHDQAHLLPHDAAAQASENVQPISRDRKRPYIRDFRLIPVLAGVFFVWIASAEYPSARFGCGC